MGNRKYEHGDQVEARLIVWYTPGEHLLQGRVVVTQWRGDDIVDSTVGKRAILRNEEELGVFVSLAAATLWARFEEDLFPLADVSSRLDDAPGPLVV